MVLAAHPHHRHMDQWDRIESPEIGPLTYGQLIFDKEDRDIKLEKVSSASSAEKVGKLHVNQ